MMKTELTIEESAKLIELGIDAKLASKEIATTISEQEYNDPRHPVFTFTDVLAALPKNLDGSDLSMEWDSIFGQWWAGYNGVQLEFETELIDALRLLLLWCILHQRLTTKSEKDE